MASLYLLCKEKGEKKGVRWTVGYRSHNPRKRGKGPRAIAYNHDLTKRESENRFLGLINF